MNVLKKKSRVLAIDDEPSMIEWLKILLEHEGHEVRTAMVGTRGEDIFKILEARRRRDRHDAAGRRRARAAP